MDSEWKDTSSYSQGDTERIPKMWTLVLGSLRIIVHRHIHYDPDQWLLSCNELGFATCLLTEKDISKARNEALSYVKSRLARWLGDVEGFIEHG
ncbi:MAG: hypothetical protein V3W44_08715 [Dehalococcoidales bacterium]